MYLYFDSNFNPSLLGSPQKRLRRVRGFTRMQGAQVVYENAPRDVRLSGLSGRRARRPYVRGLGFVVNQGNISNPIPLTPVANPVIDWGALFPPIIPIYTGPATGSAAAVAATATQNALRAAQSQQAGGIGVFLSKEIIPGSGVSTGLALGGVAALVLIAGVKGRR